MQWKNKLLVIGSSGLVLASCGVFGGGDGEALARKRVAAPEASAQTNPRLDTANVGDANDGAAQPAASAEKVNYDEVGYGSWYGEELKGNNTASGEAFNPDGISAAHRTLPIPSFAEVTDLDSGRTILVRINDRGPFKRGRIIDLSAGAARQLGLSAQGQFAVRVRRVNPPEFERRQLQNGGQATERLATPPALLAALRRNLKPGEASPTAAGKPTKALPAIVAAKPPQSTGAQFDPPDVMEGKPEPMAKPAKMPKPIPAPVAPVIAASGDYFIQIGAFSTQARALAFAKKAGALVVSAGNVWRVRTGPYADEQTARAALGPLATKGYRDARVTR
jgi:rare lipoprotein A